MNFLNINKNWPFVIFNLKKKTFKTKFISCYGAEDCLQRQCIAFLMFSVAVCSCFLCKLECVFVLN